MTELTPIQSLAGGALIGLSAALLMTVHGRIAGLTGILAGLLPPTRANDWAWRAAFLFGAVAAPFVYRLVAAGTPALQASGTPVLIFIGGLIVGAGVTYGAGCPSGHGVCGLARFSVRSFAAVLTFMATAAITVFVVRHLI